MIFNSFPLLIKPVTSSSIASGEVLQITNYCIIRSHIHHSPMEIKASPSDKASQNEVLLNRTILMAFVYQALFKNIYLKC